MEEIINDKLMMVVNKRCGICGDLMQVIEIEGIQWWVCEDTECGYKEKV